jgi:23S rRNA (guanosine2251-2'-O)-methyltransferase
MNKDRRPGPGGRTKTGKPRPGTGGHGKHRLEGKGPTPPASMRPGHPAQRAAAARQAQGKRGETRDDPRPATREREADTKRRSGEMELVIGRNAVVESLRASVPATALYVGARAQSDERVAEAVQLAANAGIAILEAGSGELERLADGGVHQGVALRVRPYSYAHPEDFITERRTAGPPLIVALDGVTDPRNLGAVARSAAAFGADGLLVPSRRSAGVTAGAWKSSAGALARLPVAKAVNLTRALETYKEAGLFVVGLDATGDVSVREMTVADAPLVIVVGSEGRGLSRVVANACDLLAKIPMTSATESLNAGVAASIALYEVASARA